jgi:chemotaxis protein histidine kinase CheA
MAAALIVEFAAEAGRALDRIGVALATSPERAALDEAFRLLHTIKGTAGFLPLPRTVRLAHAAEGVIEALREGRTTEAAAPPLLAAAIERLRALVEAAAARGCEPPGTDDDIVLPLAAVAGEAPLPADAGPMPGNGEAAEPGARADRVRSRPFRSLWPGLARLRPMLEQALDKRLALDFDGGTVSLEPAVASGLRDALAHLIRNAADHGIETPAGRVASGKPPVGTIRVTAQALPERLVVTVADDGRGIDQAAVRRAAVARGLLPPRAAPSPETLHALLFQAGFSTTPVPSAVSGRGIGLDAVAAIVRDLGGDIAIASVAGGGTTVELSLPAAAAASRAADAA